MHRATTADSLHDRARAHLPGGNTRTTVFVPPHPPYAAGAVGCRLVDETGHEVVDFQNNYTALIHGHAHPAVTAAAADAISHGASFGLPTRHEVDMAEALAERVPVGEQWRFTNSGTEAVMMAIRLARAVTGRDAVLRFEGCYHGTSDFVAGAGARGVPSAVDADVVVVPVADGTAFVSALEQHGDRIASVVLDAMPNRAGLRPAPRGFVELVRRETTRRDILLLQDEVMTFRLGFGGLHSVYAIAPDLITLGKIIGGGFPIGAIGGSREIMEAFDPRRAGAVSHGGTFQANPVSMRAGLAALELFDASAVERINALGELMRAGLAEQGWTVTGQGSLLRVHASDPDRLWWALYRAGVLLSVNGLACISTPMGEGEIEYALDAFARVRETFDA